MPIFNLTIVIGQTGWRSTSSSRILYCPCINFDIEEQYAQWNFVFRPSSSSSSSSSPTASQLSSIWQSSYQANGRTIITVIILITKQREYQSTNYSECFVCASNNIPCHLFTECAFRFTSYLPHLGQIILLSLSMHWIIIGYGNHILEIGIQKW